MTIKRFSVITSKLNLSLVLTLLCFNVKTFASFFLVVKTFWCFNVKIVFFT